MSQNIFINLPAFDWMGVLGGLLPMCFVLMIWGREMGENGRKNTFFFNFVLSLYLMRIAYLRLATNGGTSSFYDEGHFPFTDVLGSSILFAFLGILLFVAYWLRTRELVKFTGEGESVRRVLVALGVNPEDFLSHHKAYTILYKGQRIVLKIDE
jgi:hypothetical protein